MAWNFRDLSPQLQRRIVADGASPKIGQVPKPQAKVKGVQNKLEQDFYVAYLLPREQSGEFYSVKYESLALPIAFRCVYNPDFIAGTKDNQTVVWEVKAPHKWREKGLIKLKVAAQQYPQYHFYLAEKKKGTWRVTRIKRNETGLIAASTGPDQDE